MSSTFEAEVLRLFGRIDEKVDAMAADLRDHMVNEDEEIAEIKENAHKSQERIERRFDAHLQSVQALTEALNANLAKTAEKIDKALPNADPYGHHDHHMELITRSERWKARFEKWKDNWFDRAMTVAAVFALIAVWDKIVELIKKGA